MDMTEGMPQQRLSPETAGPAMAEAILRCQARLDSMPEEPGQAAEVRRQVVEELDDLWPYHGVTCVYRGWGVCSTYDGRNQAVEQKDFFEGVERSYGFEVIRFRQPGNYRWRIGYGFLTPRGAGEGQNKLQRAVFIDAATAQVAPIGREEELFLPVLEEALEPQLHAALTAQSDQLVQLFNEREFYDMAVEDQRDLVEQAIIQATKIANEFGGVGNRQLLAKADYGYMHAGPAGGPLHCRQIDLSELQVGGKCVGLYVLGFERLELSGRPIRSREDWVDSASGLCLAVLVDSSTRDTIGLDAEMLYLSISGQNLRANFRSMAGSGGAPA